MTDKPEEIPEPGPGWTTRTGRGHVWHRYPDSGWMGCLTCDPGAPLSWSWEDILDDSYDDTIEVIPG